MPQDTKDKVNVTEMVDEKYAHSKSGFEDKANSYDDIALWNNPKDDEYNWTNDAKEMVEKHLRELKGETSDAYEIVKDEPDKNNEEIKDKAENVMDATANKADDLNETSSNAYEKAKDLVEDKKDQIKENFEDKTDEIKKNENENGNTEEKKEEVKEKLEIDDTSKDLKVNAYNGYDGKGVPPEKNLQLEEMAEYTKEILLSKACDMKDAAISAYQGAAEFVAEKKDHAVEMAGSAKDVVVSKASEWKETVLNGKSEEGQISQMADSTKKTMENEEKTKSVSESLMDIASDARDAVMEKKQGTL